MTKLSVNINTEVSFQLTKTGVEVFNSFHKNLNVPEKYIKQVQEGDTLTLSLWELAHIFGSEMYMGNTKHPFFVNNSVVLDSQHECVETIA